jgi:hypothetical protein
MTRATATLALALALLAGSASAADDDDKKATLKAQADVLDLAKKIADGKDVATEAGAIRKKYDELNFVMYAYKHSDKGGIGTGLLPKKSPEGKGIDGIEHKLQRITSGKEVLDDAAIKKQKDALVVRQASIDGYDSPILSTVAIKKGIVVVGHGKVSGQP